MSSFSRASGCPLSSGGRVCLLALSALLLAGFGLARTLEPDPRGYGTHQRLGLPECAFQTLWNRSCPACGMTTCFAHLMRGEWLRAMRANPAGMSLGVVCALMIPWLWASAWRGEALGIARPLQVLLIVVLAQSGITAIVWICRMWL
jgi:hypothetical protein